MTRISLPFTLVISGIAGADAFAKPAVKTTLAPRPLGVAKNPFPELSKDNELSEDNDSTCMMDRRTVFLGFATAAAAMLPSPAHALKQKNEALCGTGFFEHIYEYKCTAIGDIEDEGYSKGLSQAESGLTDSLMGKLGVDSGDAFGDATESSSKKSDSKTNKTETVASSGKQ